MPVENPRMDVAGFPKGTRLFYFFSGRIFIIILVSSLYRKSSMTGAELSFLFSSNSLRRSAGSCFSLLIEAGPFSISAPDWVCLKYHAP